MFNKIKRINKLFLNLSGKNTLRLIKDNVFFAP